MHERRTTLKALALKAQGSMSALRKRRQDRYGFFPVPCAVCVPRSSCLALFVRCAVRVLRS
jgi:hypothetical protein